MALYPSQASQPAARLVVERETSPGSGQFEVDERLRVAEICLGSDLALPSAVIVVRTDASFGPLEARDTYHPGLRLVVRTDEADAWRRTVLFDGYAPAGESAWDFIGGASGYGCRLAAEHVAGRLAGETLVLGRHVRSLAIEQGLAAEFERYKGRSEWVSAQPCVFNFDGMSNCAAEPLTVAGPDGRPIPIHVFCGDGDPSGVAWSYARAIRYLTWFYRPRGEAFDVGNLLAATQAYAGLTDPGAVNRDDPLGRALVRAVDGVCCEAMNVVEALGVLVGSAGLHLTGETASQEGRAVSRWRLWAARGGNVKRLRLRGRAAGAGARRVLAENNAAAGRFRRDGGRVVHRPMVVGAVQLLEVTVPLWPGWPPEPDLDNVPPAQRAAAKGLAWTPEQVLERLRSAGPSDWFKRYHAEGSEHAAHADVARRWVLNEDGRYEASAYNRHAPFDSYRAFDFADVVEGAEWGVARWMRRPRRLWPCVSGPAAGAVWVELSFDGGMTWQALAGGFRVLEEECGIELRVANPTQIAPAGADPREQNLWYALVDQTLRVRVTAVIETDERLLAEPPADARWRAALWHQRQVVYEPETFGRVTAEGGGSVLAGGSGVAAAARDDRAKAAALAERLAGDGGDDLLRASPRIPWIDLEYQIGDRISGVSGAGPGLDSGGGTERVAPAVVGKRFVLSDGRYETQLLLGAPAEVE